MTQTPEPTQPPQNPAPAPVPTPARGSRTSVIGICALVIIAAMLYFALSPRGGAPDAPETAAEAVERDPYSILQNKVDAALAPATTTVAPPVPTPTPAPVVDPNAPDPNDSMPVPGIQPYTAPPAR